MTSKYALIGAIVIPLVFVVVLANGLKTPATKGDKYNDQRLTTSIESEKVNREKILAEFFKKYKSPLAANVQKFVEVADKYNIDYRLLPAISCTESTCGKFLIPDSYNPFGWGIYGTTVTKFSSYDEAIETVAAGLKKGYLSRGLDTPEEIAPIYTPPSYKHWMAHTRWFMNQMDEIALNAL